MSQHAQTESKARATKGAAGREVRSTGIEEPTKGAKLSSRRVAKNRVLARIKQDTVEVRSSSLIPELKRQGYEELPIDEIQERLSKLERSLSEYILAGRG